MLKYEHIEFFAFTSNHPCITIVFRLSNEMA